jgi:hypothetical protein
MCFDKMKRTDGILNRIEQGERKAMCGQYKVQQMTEI